MICVPDNRIVRPLPIVRATKRDLVIVDLYSGAGGATTGMLLALERAGYRVKHGVAANHWDKAIATHSANHPNIKHYCAGIETIDPCKAVPGGRVDILWASPECTHHSKARGGKPMQDQSRTGANHILPWLDKLYVANLLIENVPEFQDWGPLTERGQPIKSKIGECFRAFIAALEARNYKVDWREICCADYGDATTRTRLIMCARRGADKRILWKEPTHRPSEKITDLFGTFKPWKAAREIIDWSDLGTPLHEKPLKQFEIFQCESVISRSEDEAGTELFKKCGWSKTRQKSKKAKPITCCPKCKGKISVTVEWSPLSPNTMRRIFAGLEKFMGIPFVLETRTDGDRVRSVDRPLQTLTADSRGINLAAPFILGQQSGATPRPVTEPLPSIATDGAISLTTPLVVQTDQTGSNGSCVKTVDAPLGTLVSKQNQAVVSSFVLPNDGPNMHWQNPARSTDAPIPTVTQKGAGFLVSCCHGEGDETRRQHDPDKPLPTLQGTNQFGVVQADAGAIVSTRHGDEVRTTDAEKPLPTLTGKGEWAVAKPFIVPTNYGEAPGQKPRTHSVDKPLPAVVGSQTHAICQPFVVRLRGTRSAQVKDSAKSVDEPLGAISTSGAHHAVASAFLTEYYGTGGAETVNLPLKTQSTRDRFLLVNPQTNEQREIIIYFRLLKLRELADAHSFPKNYVFSGTKTEGVKQVGNSNPVEMTAAMTSMVLTLQPARATRRVKP